MFSVGVLAVYFGIVEAGNRGIIGELVVKVVLAGNQRGDVVLEIEVKVDGEAEGVVLLLYRESLIGVIVIMACNCLLTSQVQVSFLQDWVFG